MARLVSEGCDRERKRRLTLIPDRPCCFSNTFSGFISQWIILFLYRVSRHWSKECANLRTSCREKPWNLFFLISSYRLIDKSSKVMQVWDLKQKGLVQRVPRILGMQCTSEKCHPLHISQHFIFQNAAVKNICSDLAYLNIAIPNDE